MCIAAQVHMIIISKYRTDEQIGLIILAIYTRVLLSCYYTYVRRITFAKNSRDININ